MVVRDGLRRPWKWGESGRLRTCAEMKALRTCSEREYAVPSPRWPTSGSHSSPSRVTVRRTPPPWTSVSELLETRELER